MHIYIYIYAYIDVNDWRILMYANDAISMQVRIYYVHVTYVHYRRMLMCVNDLRIFLCICDCLCKYVFESLGYISNI